MANKQRLFISSSSFGASLKSKKLMGVGIEEFLKRWGPVLLLGHFKNTLLHKSVLRLHLFFTALQILYDSVPPGLHSLYVTEWLIQFLPPSIMNCKMCLFVVHIFPQISAFVLLQPCYLSGLAA